VEGFRAEIRVENRRKASLHLRAKTIKNKKLNSDLIQTTNSQIFKKNKRYVNNQLKQGELPRSDSYSDIPLTRQQKIQGEFLFTFSILISFVGLRINKMFVLTTLSVSKWTRTVNVTVESKR
jgi:hypothetical protein